MVVGWADGEEELFGHFIGDVEWLVLLWLCLLLCGGGLWDGLGFVKG